MQTYVLSLTEYGPYDHMEDSLAMYTAGALLSAGFPCKLKQTQIDKYDPFFISRDTSEKCILFISFQKITESLYHIFEQIKNCQTGLSICCIGLCATQCGQEIINECKYIDYIIKGDAEITAVQLVKTIQKEMNLNSVEDIIYRCGGENLTTPGVSVDRPQGLFVRPVRTFIQEMNLIVASVRMAKGANRESDIYIEPNNPMVWQARKTVDVIEEIRELYELYGVDCIHFTDIDFFPPGGKDVYTVQLLQGLIDLDFNIYYGASFFSDFYQNATPGLISMLNNSGLTRVKLQVLAANQEDLDYYGIHAKVDEIYNVTELFKEMGVPYYPEFFNFQPYSTINSLEQNFLYLSKFQLSGRLSLFMSQANLRIGGLLYQQANTDGLLTRKNKYCFMDRRVEKIFNSLSSVRNKLNLRYDNILIKLDTLQMKADVLSYILKLRLKNAQAYSDNIQAVFEAYDLKNTTIKKELNKLGELLFPSLISDAKVKSADSLSIQCQQLLDIKLLSQFADEFNLNTVKLLKQMIKMGYRVDIRL